MTELQDSKDIEELKALMLTLKNESNTLKEHLLDGVIIRHNAFAIKRDRDIFTPIKFEAELNAVKSLFQIISGDPLNTKEAELFPGFIQVRYESYAITMALTDAVNVARSKIKSFLISNAKKTRITNEHGVTYTQNPLMYHHCSEVNTLQVYRHLSAVKTNTTKSSFLWQSNKRYLKYNKNQTSNIIHSAKLSPVPLHVDHKEWQRDIESALIMIGRMPDNIEITKICSTEPKPHFKFKPVDKKLWTSHYGATPLIIANNDDMLFSVDKKMQSIDVQNKHKNLPVGNNWTPLCKSLNLYYQP